MEKSQTNATDVKMYFLEDTPYLHPKQNPNISTLAIIFAAHISTLANIFAAHISTLANIFAAHKRCLCST